MTSSMSDAEASEGAYRPAQPTEAFEAFGDQPYPAWAEERASLLEQVKELSQVTRDAAENKHRLTVVFADSTYRTLEYLATKKGRSKAEVLRDVIALGKYFEDVTASGGHILVERGGTTREIVIT